MPLEEVINNRLIRNFKPSLADVKAVVADNNKKRFELEDRNGLFFIRAV